MIQPLTCFTIGMVPGFLQTWRLAKDQRILFLIVWESFRCRLAPQLIFAPNSSSQPSWWKRSLAAGGPSIVWAWLLGLQQQEQRTQRRQQWTGVEQRVLQQQTMEGTTISTQQSQELRQWAGVKQRVRQQQRRDTQSDNWRGNQPRYNSCPTQHKVQHTTTSGLRITTKGERWDGGSWVPEMEPALIIVTLVKMSHDTWTVRHGGEEATPTPTREPQLTQRFLCSMGLQVGRHSIVPHTITRPSGHRAVTRKNTVGQKSI